MYYADLRRDFESFKACAEAAQAERDSLKTTLAAKDKEINDLSSNLTLLKEVNADLITSNKDISFLKDEISNLTRQLNEAEREIGDLNKELLISKDKYRLRSKDYAQEYNKNYALIQENEKLKNEVTEISNRLTLLERELNVLPPNSEVIVGRDFSAVFTFKDFEPKPVELKFDTKTHETKVNVPVGVIDGQNFTITYKIPKSLEEKINRLENRIVAVESCCGID